MTQPSPEQAGGPGVPGDTRSRLLDAATELFVSKGYEPTSIGEIARKAGLSTGAVYSAYGSKLELLRAVIARETSLLGRYDETAPADLREVVARQGRAFAESGGDEALQGLAILQFEYLLQALRSPGLRDETAAAWREGRGAAAEALARLAEAEGRELALPPDAAVLVWSALLSGLQLLRLVDPESVPEGLYDSVLRWLVNEP